MGSSTAGKAKESPLPPPPADRRAGECWAVILAAGRGSRLAVAAGGTAKQFLHWRGAPLWWASASALAASPRVSGLVLVFPPDMLETAATELADRDRRHGLGVPWRVVAGGERRQDSVRHGLGALPSSCELVLIHDSARPFVTPALATRVASLMAEAIAARRTSGGTKGAMGVIPGLPVTDTIKETDAASLVLRTPDRASLRAVQTPQAFPVEALRRAHARARNEGWEVTDDASLMERCGCAVLVTDGDPCNIKLTHPRDLTMLEERGHPRPCAGYGYDVHRYGGGRPLVLGGVPIPCGLTVAAHSDGDVLLHALMDALLGCAGEGDIGRHFPDSDPRWDNISSSLLLDRVLEIAADAGLILTHVDLTVVAQKPRLAPHADAIRRNVARLLNLDERQVNFKATTEEGLGFTGEISGLKAVALVSALAVPDAGEAAR